MISNGIVIKVSLKLFSSKRGNRRITLEQISKTASSLADGDLVEKAIRSKNAWSLLPTQVRQSHSFSECVCL